MEMEVVVPVPAMDFNFDSACSSPYMTAPSSPQPFGNFFFSVPTRPTRVSSFHRELNDLSHATNSSAAVPFQWEEKPGTPKRKSFEGRVDDRADKKGNQDDDGGGEDFEFNFSGQLDRTSLSAEELFDGGKIKPLKPPPRYEQFSSTVSSPRSRNPFLNREFDPFEAAIEKTRRRGAVELKEPPKQKQEKEQNYMQSSQQRGRERTNNSGSSSSSSSYNYVHKKSRSLSPFRVSDIMFEPEESSSSKSAKNVVSTASNNPKSFVSSILSTISFSKGNRKWKLKDFLLFRSASEGRATSKDPLRRYGLLSKKEPEDVRNASFRSTDSIGSTSSRRRGPISAHELHYTANRAITEEMRRKTFLPYKQGLLGCLGFNPGMHEISRGSIGSLTRG